MSGETPLEGPPPTWRDGYEQDEPIYLEVVRAMGVPGLDGPTGGDVVQGESYEPGEREQLIQETAEALQGTAAERREASDEGDLSDE